MASSARSHLPVAVVFALFALSLARRPLPLEWSSTTYGPDGPWHAVRVGIGSPIQHVDLFPHFYPTSWPLLPQACPNQNQENVCAGGTYNPRDSNSLYWQAQKVSNDQVPIIFDNETGPAQYNFITGSNVTTLGDDITLYLDGSDPIKVPDTGFDALGHNIHNYVSYNGSSFPTYPLNAGYLSMGYPAQIIAYNEATTNGYNVIYPYLFKNNTIPSASIGMTSGSPSLNVPPSFYMGGYDRNRVVGPVLTQRIAGGAVPEVTLARIFLGNEMGPAVFPKALKNSIKASGTANTAILADITPGSSNMALPPGTCRQLADQLPLTYDDSIGYYLWDTSDAAYDRIMKSSGYLGFDILRDGGSKESITIKVPIQLLNLTLESPIVSNPKPYFPCMDAPLGLSSNALGRPFLQAAVFVINWSVLETTESTTSFWSLAQASGPNIPEQPDVVSLDPQSNNIKSADFSWAQSWAGYWNDGSTDRGLRSLNDADGNSSSSDGGGSGGLSTGAKAGIGVGVGVGVGILLSVLAFFLYRKTRKTKQTTTIPEKAELPEDDAQPTYPIDKKDAQPIEELDARVLRSELPQTNSQVYAEMPGSVPELSELDDTQTKLPSAGQAK